MTSLGAAVVFFFPQPDQSGDPKSSPWFAAGVMIAASVWSLLIPAIEEAEASGGIGWLPAAGGFLLGVLFLVAMDNLPAALASRRQRPGRVSSSWKRATLLIFAVTLHNIPEGMAAGLSLPSRRMQE